MGRQGAARTWPVSGGSLRDAGMATPRAISFAKRGQEMVGHTGQTSTQIVILTKPPQSYMVIPLGESDHPDSPHFDDQAEKLFSQEPREIDLLPESRGTGKARDERGRSWNSRGYPSDASRLWATWRRR